MKTVATISGKGGTGKTFIALALSQFLSDRGNRVGVLDADIDSPNLYEMLSISDIVKATRTNIIPARYNENTMIFSMGPLLRETHCAKTGDSYAQIITDVAKAEWDNPEYMIVDLPAGSSDELKAVLSSFSDSMVGVVIIATPMNIQDLYRTVSLCNYFRIPILGVIINMYAIECSKCGELTIMPYAENIDDIVSTIANTYDTELPIVGKIPFSVDVAYSIRDNEFTKYIEDSIVEIVERIDKSKVDAERHKFWKSLLKIARKIEFAVAKELVEFFALFINTVNKKVDIRALQDKYNLNQQKVTQINVMYKNKVVFQQNIRIRDGKLRLVKNPKKIEAWITIEVTAIANVLLGKTDMKTAFFSDDIRAVGDNSTSGMIMFINDIYKEVEPQLRDDFGKLGGRLLKILTK